MFQNRLLLFGLFWLFTIFSLSARGQGKLSGSVTDKADGLPIPGVSIRVEGKNTGAITDTNGQFSIQAASGDVLSISYIGYQTQTFKINNAGKIQIALEQAKNNLQEVVITALGINKEKKSLGYAIQEVKGSDLAEAKESNLVNALAGKVAGVNITNSQGNMGSSRIVIRGETSISGNNQPLFVVDGVPVDNSQLGAGGSRDFANAISDINSEDIETISVLKGPNAAALYGSRAANGVIIIKTKSGKRGKASSISINSSTTFEDLLVLPEYQDVFGQGSNGEFSYVNGKDKGVNDGVDESWGPKMDGRLIPQFNSNGVAVPFVPHPNNVRDFFETGHTLNNGVSFTGGGDAYNYRFSYNNSAQKGVIPNSELNKNSFGLNTSFDLLPKLKLDLSANYVRTSSDNLPGAGGKRSTSTMLQFLWFGRQVDVGALKNYIGADGQPFNWNNSYYSNPYFIAYENTVAQRRDRLIGTVGLTYQINSTLKANFHTGNDYYNDRRKLKVAYGTNGTPLGSYQEVGYTVNENNTEASLSFNKHLNKDFNLDVLAGGNLRSKFNEENNQTAQNLAVAGIYTLKNSRDPLISSNSFGKLKVYSVFSSAQLGFRDYAYLNVTARNDWSSTLPAKNNSYFYPSVNGSLILSEAFDWKSDVLTFAKLRGGWSRVGKDTDPYQLLNTYSFNPVFGSYPLLSLTDRYLNPDLKPEYTNSSEIGFELAFLKSRIRLDVSAYNTNSFNQIFNADVSSGTGFSQKLINAGRINNKGVEVQLGLTPVKQTGGLQWDVNVNYSLNRSKVVELDPEGNFQNVILGSGGVQVLASVGQPYGTLFGTTYLRNANGDILVNSSGYAQVDPTKHVLGVYTPKWIGSINNDFSYKGFTLGFLVDAKVGGLIYSGTHATGFTTGVLAETLPGRDEEHGGLPYYYPGNNKTLAAVQLSSHSSTAPGAATVYHDGVIFDGVRADGSKNTSVLSAQQYYKAIANVNEAHVFSATAIRLREVSLGYNLPKNLISKVGLTNARFTLIGRNLWIIHKNVPNIDPETAFATDNAQGLESLQLPTTRSYGFSLNLTF
ncbi:SusC/RagA family TonB-linked outer membrane protein [Pedobacter punctiformis]|uniref:SusC/RagA family TonB-linked outer membrane protein n=1 Tax=Pedobacter punctiformis TaxID=3004097 RepID=A0ABT4LD64_9SPHI|nr:SusC/RagA family TonB-linked outer membrane protein [Pedobacter sp. HCMS5-2]MCZ4245828.1 SusC/RagA family TonB-linked outer membrane protein [Pedobacter sp. HCMS5-2]